MRVQVLGPVPPELWYGLQVVLLSENGNGSYGLGPDERGRWTFDPCPEGDYGLMLRIFRESTAYTIAETERLRIGPGVSDLAIECPPLYDLTIAAPGLDKATSVFVCLPDKRMSVSIFAEIVATSGRITIPHLPAGLYEAGLTGAQGRGRVRFVLPASGEVVLPPADGKETR